MTFNISKVIVFVDVPRVLLYLTTPLQQKPSIFAPLGLSRRPSVQVMFHRPLDLGCTTAGLACWSHHIPRTGCQTLILGKSCKHLLPILGERLKFTMLQSAKKGPSQEKHGNGNPLPC